MLGAEQITDLEKLGYTKIRDIAPLPLLDRLRKAYDGAWAAEEGGISQRLHLLAHPAFREFIDTPSVLAAPRALFGDQLQLLDYWLTYQPAAARWRPAKYTVPTERDWHRDVSFLGTEPARPLTLNMLLFLDDVAGDCGPTVVLPGSHLGKRAPVHEHSTDLHPDEVAVPLTYGEALLFNSHLVHSRGRNRSRRPRRGVALLWGYWFIKPTGAELPLCQGALVDASDERLTVVGARQPTVDLYLFDSF